MSVAYRIITWNMQGGGLADVTKKQILQDAVKRSVEDVQVKPIILLQEAGKREAVDTMGKIEYGQTSLYGKDYNIYQLLPYKYSSYEEKHENVNYRCTLQTLLPKKIKNVCVHHIDSGYDNRPLLVTDISDLRIANMHAPSGVPNFAISCINQSIGNLNLFDLPWILGGDMNYDARDYSDEILPFCRVVAPEEATHNNGGIYDYFFCHSSIPKCKVWTESVAASDHEMVIMDILRG